MILHFSALLSHRSQSISLWPPPPTSSLFWGNTFLSVTGAEKSKSPNKQKKLFENNLTKSLTHATFYGKKQTNLIQFFLLCSVSFFRWLCLRLLWLPRVCYIDHPNLLNQTKCRERWANFSVPATWTPITPPERNCPFAYTLRLMSQRLERWEASECLLPLVTFHTLCRPWDVPGHLDMTKATGTLFQ